MSNEDPIEQLTERVLNHFNEGHKTLDIFIDLAKTFDTVAHCILLQMLNGVGVRGTELALFESSLSHRTQQVKVNNLIEEQGAIECGGHRVQS